MIATINPPLWTLAAAGCVLCLIPDVIGWVRRLVGVSEREPRVRPVKAQRTPQGHGDPFVPASRSLTSTDDWARDGDWAA